MSKKMLEKSLINMLTRDKDYFLYAFMASQCRIKEDKSVDTMGVNFINGRYNLYINPDFYNELPLNKAKGVIKHEMLHVLYKHVYREPEPDYNHYAWNYSCDMAINQQIKREDLPEGSIFPENHKLPSDLNAEQYYFLLKEQFGEGDGEGDGDSEGKGGKGKSDGEGKKSKPQNPFGVNGEGNPGFDEHDWEDAKKVDEEFFDDVTRNMIEKAIKETQKTAGTLPSEISNVLEIFKKKAVVNWKNAIRKITGNKRANVRTTIKRRSRRFPKRLEIPGKTKNYTFDTLVVLDVSGSMNDNEIISGLNEINEVCKQTNSSLRLIQVDSKPFPSEEYKKDMKLFNRKASGGTYLYPAIKQAEEEQLNYNLLIVISDMGLFDNDIEQFNNVKKPQIWLSTTGEFNKNLDERIKQFNIKDYK